MSYTDHSNTLSYTDHSNTLSYTDHSNTLSYTDNSNKQAGAELAQAQLKLGLDFTLIFCRFALSRFGLINWFSGFSFVTLLKSLRLVY